MRRSGRSFVALLALVAALLIAPAEAAWGPEGSLVSQIDLLVGSDSAPGGAYRIANPYAVPGLFRKAALHVHTSNSFDGDHDATPGATARAFKAAGYGFLVYTDHDFATVYHDQDDSTFVTGTGYESTGADGHLGALLLDQVVETRLPVQKRIDAIRQLGGIVTANHPDYEVGFRGDQLMTMSNYQFVEVYNEITTNKDGKIEANIAHNVEKWRTVVNRRGAGRPVWCVGVSDTHKAFTGGGWTVVKTADVTLAALREAMLRGSMYASTGADFDSLIVVDGTIVVHATDEDQIRFVDQDGRIVGETIGGVGSYRPAPGDRWVRAELVDPYGGRAWSQPLWISRAPTDVATS